MSYNKHIIMFKLYIKSDSTWTVTTPWNMFLSECPPETSTLHFPSNILSSIENNISPKQKRQKLKRFTYASRNIPASLKHFTFVERRNRSLKSSQCRVEANPPAEQPESRACTLAK